MGRQAVCGVYHKGDNRLGHYTSGEKGIDASIRASTVPKLVVDIDNDDDEDDSDKMCVVKQQCSLIPGKYRLIRPGEEEELREKALNNADNAPIQVKSSVKVTDPS